MRVNRGEMSRMQKRGQRTGPDPMREIDLLLMEEIILRRLRVNRGEMSGMRRQRPDPDPMREIDLLLMEEIMMRRNFPTNARTRAVQTLCMLVVLAALTGMFIHALTHRDATSIVSVPALSDSPNRMPTVP